MVRVRLQDQASTQLATLIGARNPLHSEATKQSSHALVDHNSSLGTLEVTCTVHLPHLYHTTVELCQSSPHSYYNINPLITGLFLYHIYPLYFH